MDQEVPEQPQRDQKDITTLKNEVTIKKGRFSIFLYISHDKNPNALLSYYRTNREIFAPNTKNQQDPELADKEVKTVFEKDVADAKSFFDLIKNGQPEYLSEYIARNKKEITDLELELNEKQKPQKGTVT